MQVEIEKEQEQKIEEIQEIQKGSLQMLHLSMQQWQRQWQWHWINYPCW